jgi:uncharacterized protein DUF4352
VRRATLAALAAVLVTAGCSGGGSSASAGSNTAPPSSTLPVSGTVTYKDGKVYTVAPLGAKLALDDVSVKIDGVAWVDRLGAPLPPGMKMFGVVRLTITNTSGVAQTLTPTQIWLLDRDNHAFLASVGAQVDHPLIGVTIPPGKSVTGTLAFPAPTREKGNLLVYRFADSTAIAHAHHVGLIRYG